MAYVYCRSEEARPPTNMWHGSLHDSRTACMEKLISVQRNTYSSTKLRWDRSYEMSSSSFVFFFSLQNDITDWCTSSVHSAAVASHSTVAFCKSIEAKRKKKTLTGLHSLDVVLKLPKKIFLCGLLLLWERRLSQKKKIPELTYFSSDASDCTYQWETAEWTCKILFRQKKTGWLKYFECKIIVPFWCFEAFLVHLTERGKKGNIHSITYLPLLPSFERRNWTVLKPKSLVFKFTFIKKNNYTLLQEFKIGKWESMSFDLHDLRLIHLKQQGLVW